MNVMRAMLFLFFLAHAMDNDFKLNFEEIKNKGEVPHEHQPNENFSGEFFEQKHEKVRMENEDLFKLSYGEFHDKVKYFCDEVTETKRNKGTFFKATNGRKTIYFLGSMHFYMHQDFFDHVLDKIKAQLKNDENERILRLWTERSVDFRDDEATASEKVAKIWGLKADNIHLKKYVEAHLEYFKCITDHRFAKAFGNTPLKFLDAKECIKRVDKNISKDSNEKKVPPEHRKLDRTNLAFMIAKAYHKGDILKIANQCHNPVRRTNKLMLKKKKATMYEKTEVEPRNKDWVELLKSESSDVQFVIAGTAHMFYNTGVPMLLQMEGWQIEHIDLDIPDRFTEGLEKSLLNYHAKQKKLLFEMGKQSARAKIRAAAEFLFYQFLFLLFYEYRFLFFSLYSLIFYNSS